MEKFTVDGKGDSEGMRLAEIKNFQLDFDLFSVIGSSQLEIEAIKLKNFKVHIMVNTAGNANYNIAKSDKEEENR